jgi:thioredoxin-dependent peroxiredoxin
MLDKGHSVPTVQFQMTDGKLHTFEEFRGQTLVLYFYPKDHTSGCTLEAQDFRDNLPLFSAKNAIVLGVSKDSLKSHCTFREKHQLPFDLIVDTEDSKLSEQFGVWKEKSMYGKKYFGIERSTFVITPEGKIAQVWRKVSVPSHVKTVLESLK